MNEHLEKHNIMNWIPVLSDDYTRDVELCEFWCIKTANKKNICTLVRAAESIYQFNEWKHLKRVKSSFENIAAILIKPVCTYSTADDVRRKLLDYQSVGGIVSSCEFTVVKVPSVKPLTRSQYKQAMNHWPVYFHEDKQLEKMISCKHFTENDLKLMEKYMDIAISATLPHAPSHPCSAGVVMVDPAIHEIVAVAPRQGKQSSHHCLQHPVMLCIDLVSFQQGGGAWASKEQAEGDPSSSWTPSPPQKPDSKRFKRTPQYLCTGYDMYVTTEPCIMCSMALVHSRIGRVFYGTSNPSIGGLGSIYKIHSQAGINHHFEVYRRVMEKECECLHK